MMKLRSMLHVVRETEAGRLPVVVGRAAALWAHDPGSVQYVRSSANHIFRLTRAEMPFYLRLSPASERQPAGLEAELAFVKHAAESGLWVARPVPSEEARLIERVADEEGRAYYAILFEGLVGQAWLEPEELSAEMFREWGRTAARLHNAAQGYRPAGRPRPAWRELVAEALEQLTEEPAVRRAVGEVAEQLESRPVAEATYGLIHGDLELDNLVWDGRRFGVIDFDDAARHWYAADVAKAVSDLDGKAEQIGLFLEGYGEEREAVPDVADLVLFQRLEKLLSFARLLRAYEGQAAADDPPWLAGLRERHKGWLEGVRREVAAGVKLAT